MNNQTIVSIDAGAVSISCIEMDLNKNILRKEYKFHEGRIRESIAELLSSVRNRESQQFFCCTGSTSEFVDHIQNYENLICIIEAAKFYFSDLRSIVHVGGEKFYYFRFDEEGRYIDMKTSSSCAAGTGSFLDQQSKRLGLSGSHALAEKALRSEGEPPKIASRCSVFAKTDLIHAQQEGYTLNEICNGLCMGLANNIADTLFTQKPESPIVFSGGVSRNESVVTHLEKRINAKMNVSEYSQYFGAIGAALLMLENNKKTAVFPELKSKSSEKEYYYPELALRLSEYPSFEGIDSFIFNENIELPHVETDVYMIPDGNDGSTDIPCFIGIDIGSTSTKAVITDENGEPIAGFYTRTSGQPVRAVRGIFAAVDYTAGKHNMKFSYKGAATTGSGRKFIGKIIGSDLILDEISAHARAAYSLDPEIDTIIEIGGQDAKFTTMKNGVVTFSKMNTVCAAGTGSFIEEQAQKLGVKLSEYSSLVENKKSPLASDRCTVFMERDINHFIGKNYSVEECLAAVLYSIRENYLLKVAVEGAVGNRVCFQGATAKNKALAAAFEQKLNKPVFVSKYCHLTGALGCALTLIEEKKNEKTSFKGIDLYKKDIPIKSETCTLCLNHCRIRIAEVKDEEVAFGFLCGRDYSTNKFVAKNSVESIFDLRNKILRTDKAKVKKKVMGLPAALQVFDEIYFWKNFFERLDIPFTTSEELKNPVSRGKNISDAEFCAPLTAAFGHASFVAEKSDCLFLPIYLEDKPDEKKPDRLRKYCYYSQLSSSIVSQVIENQNKEFINPVINYKKGSNAVKKELFTALKKVYPDILFDNISKSYDEADAAFNNYKSRLKNVYSPPEKGEIAVVILGRPYTVLSKSMNKGIPDIFASHGIKTYYQDMLPDSDDKIIEPVLDTLHWSYTSSIVRAASFCSTTEGVYPVLVTSFKCSPDSFVQDYFSGIMEARNKPYLILQIDEHDSNVGYETRIEAAVRSFKNHLANDDKNKVNGEIKIHQELDKDISGKILILPNWDPITIPLIQAVLSKEKFDVRLLEETPEKISEGMKTNTGQCIPINAIVSEYIDYIKKYNLNPENVTLWLPISSWACNIKMYPYYAKSLLEAEGNGMEKAGVYLGNITQIEFGAQISIQTYLAYLFGGILHKFGCRFRPYENEKGTTDKAVEEGQKIFIKALKGEINYKKAIEEVLKIFEGIKVTPGNKPKAAIFGDIYVRDNPVMNQNLVKFIEESGGEVVVTPYNEYAKIVSSTYFKVWMKELQIGDFLLYKALLAAMEFIEGNYYYPFEQFIGKPASSGGSDIEKKLSKFNLRFEQVGETNDNILKIYHIMENYPDLAFFVHTSPAFCCPSLVTESFCHKIEEIFGVPVVNIIYDGTNTFKNDVIMPYIKYPRKKNIPAERSEDSRLSGSLENIFQKITKFYHERLVKK